MTAVEDVDEKAEAQPHDESEPGDDGESRHEAAAENDRDQRKPRHERNFEDARAVGLRAAQDDYTQRDQDEGEEGADVREIGGVADGKDSSGDANGEAGDPG